MGVFSACPLFRGLLSSFRGDFLECVYGAFSACPLFGGLLSSFGGDFL